MNAHVPERILECKDAANRYLYRVCGQTGARVCPRCQSSVTYGLRSGRQRCRCCRYTFSEFSGRWLGLCRLSCLDWVTLVRLFEAGHSSSHIARALGRAYATAFHAVTVTRAAILAHGCTGAALLGDDPQSLVRLCCHRGTKVFRIAGHVPVFGICEEAGSVAVPVLPELSPDVVLGLPVKKARRGRIVYTGQIECYDALVFHTPDPVESMPGVRFSRSPTYIDGASQFWAYAIPRLAAHRGVSPEYFPLYLKELEFRYNHRGEPLGLTLLRYLSDPLPRPRSSATARARSEDWRCATTPAGVARMPSLTNG